MLSVRLGSCLHRITVYRTQLHHRSELCFDNPSVQTNGVYLDILALKQLDHFRGGRLETLPNDCHFS